MKNYYDPPRINELCEFTVYDDDNLDLEACDDWEYEIDDKDRQRYAFELDPNFVHNCNEIITELWHFGQEHGLKSDVKSREFFNTFIKIKASVLYAAHLVDANTLLVQRGTSNLNQVVILAKQDLLDWARAKKLINSKQQ